MQRIEGEDCPICFRTYCQEIQPVAIGCGHSLCKDSSRAVRQCPLCRARLPPLRERPTNYTLLSLLDRLNDSDRVKETRDVEIQTEKPPRLKKAIVPKGVELVTPGVALDVLVKLTRIQAQLLKVFI